MEIGMVVASKQSVLGQEPDYADAGEFAVTAIEDMFPPKLAKKKFNQKELQRLSELSHRAGEIFSWQKGLTLFLTCFAENIDPTEELKEKALSRSEALPYARRASVKLFPVGCSSKKFSRSEVRALAKESHLQGESSVWQKMGNIYSSCKGEGFDISIMLGDVQLGAIESWNSMQKTLSTQNRGKTFLKQAELGEFIDLCEKAIKDYKELSNETSNSVS